MEGRRENTRVKKLKNSPMERCLCGIAGTLLFVAASILLMESKFFRKHWGSFFKVFLCLSNAIQFAITCVFIEICQQKTRTENKFVNKR